MVPCLLRPLILTHPSIRFIILGIVVILFLQCLSALLNPASYTKGGLRWLLVIHIGAMFMFVTVFTAINLNIISNSNIDNRGFPDDPHPGPLGYQALTFSGTSGIVSTVMFLLNNWLADGLLVKSARLSRSGI